MKMIRQFRISLAVLCPLTFWLGTFAMCHCVQAERPACYQLLPAKTLAYVRVADVQELVEKFDETSIGRIMKQQQLKSLSKQLYDEAEVAFQPMADQLGLTITELLQIPQGEIAVAAVAPPHGLPAIVLMIDIEGQEDKVEKIWDLVDVRLRAQMSESSEELEGTTMTVFTQNDPRWTGVVRFQKESMQVVCTNLDVAKQILAAWNGDDQQGVLQDNEDFADVMRRSRGPRQASPQIRWFVDPISLAKVAFRGNLGAQTALAALPVVGADGLLALGGSLTFAVDEYDAFTQAHVITAEPRTGALAMLAMQRGDPTPESWVPHDVASYQTMYWDIEKTQKEFAILYDSFAGEDAFERDFVQKGLDQVGVDVIAELLEAWGGRVSLASWFHRPARFRDAEYLGGIKLTEDHDVQQVLAKVVERVGEDLEQQVFAGIKYYASPTPDTEAKEEENEWARSPMQICFGVVDDYLLIANRPSALERGIVTRNASSKKLDGELDFKLLASKLRRQPGGKAPGLFIFERPEEAFRVMYDLAAAQSTRQLLASQADSNKLLGTLHQALEDNPLPPFSVLRKHLAPTGSIITSDESGFHYTGIGLRRK